MYEKITGENAYQVPMRIYPAVHYTMGGLWVDYNLMSTMPGLFVLGEANFSDHGANRLGASALMQGLADGYFVLPYTIGNYLATAKQAKVDTDRAEFKKADGEADAHRPRSCSAIKGKRTVDSFHRELGKLMWEKCGMARNEKGLEGSAQPNPRAARGVLEERQRPRDGEELNQNLEHAGRVADFLEFGELLCLRRAASPRILRRPFPRGIPDRRTARPSATTSNFAYVAAWEYQGAGKPPVLHKEPLVFEEVHMSSAATSEACNEPHSASLAAEGRRRRTASFVDYDGQGHQRRHVVSRDARRRQRRA